MKRGIALAVLLALAVPVMADDAIPAKTLAEIKAATVFIKMETARVGGSGSGFVIRSDKDGVLVVTNAHVVQPPAAAGPVRKLEVVFRSGKAKEEATYPAEVLAADADRDLAVLRVKKVANPPTPIDLTAKAEATETTTVFTVGFPFGDILSTNDGNPAVTVSKTSVSSLREDDEGELSTVQLEGGINPGNSGGPVLDSKGRLVGISVAKLRGTNIGFAIPPMELTKMLHGRIGACGVRVIKSDANTAEVEITLQFIDPLEKVTAASILVQPAGTQPLPKAPKRGEIPELPDPSSLDVKIDKQKGTIKARLPLERHFYQIVYTNESRKDIHTGVSVFDLPTLARVGTPVAKPNTTPGTPTTSGPKPVNPLPTGEIAVGDLKVNSVGVSSGVRPQPGQPMRGVVPCLTWTADSKGFYAIDRGAQMVRRFSFPELKEEAKLEVGKDCSWLCLSKEGVVMTVAGDQEAWVLDPATLKKGVSFPVNKATRVVSAPSLSVAYVCDTDDGPLGGGTLRVVDLKTGKKLKEYETKDLGKNCGLNTPVISTDGKHLFTSGGIEQLQQYALDGDKVKFVTTSERLLQGAFNQPVVSADGSLVCAPAGGGNYTLKGKTATTYSTYIFTPGNLSEPIVELKTGAYPRAIGFDTKAGLFYAQNFQDQLIVLDRDGSKLKSYKLSKDQSEPCQFLPHPDGWKVLVLVSGGPFGGNGTAFAIEIPKK